MKNIFIHNIFVAAVSIEKILIKMFLLATI